MIGITVFFLLQIQFSTFFNVHYILIIHRIGSYNKKVQSPRISVLLKHKTVLIAP